MEEMRETRMSAAKSRKGAAVLLAVFAALSARAEVLRILDFEDRNERFEARACDGCSAAFSTNFATSGSSSLRLHSRSWQSKADKCTKATFPVDADFSRFDRIAFDVRLDHVKGCGGTITFSGGSFNEIVSFRLPRPGTRRFVIDLPPWTRTNRVESVTFTSSRPVCEIDVYVDNVVLLDAGETGYGALDGYIESLEGECSALESERDHLRDYARFYKDAAKASGVAGGVLVGKATSMDRVRPRAAFKVDCSMPLGIALAGNEAEAVQLLLSPADADLLDVRVELEGDLVSDGATFKKECVKVVPMGYVHSRMRESRFEQPERPLSGWWPEPLLDFPFRLDIRGTDVQSFWVRARAPYGQKAGTYRGTLVISSSGAETRKVPLEVRVRAFSLPRGFHMPAIVAMSPWGMRKVPEDKRQKCAQTLGRGRLKEYVEFFEEYELPYTKLYARAPEWGIVDFAHSRGKLETLVLGWIEAERNMAKPFDLEAWRADYMPQLERSYNEAKKRGILGKCVFFLCDEMPVAAQGRMRAVAKEVKAKFPDVPILTTAYNPELGEKGSVLDLMDGFCPTTKYYFDNLAAVSNARSRGQKVWWYICKDPEPPYANAYVSSPALALRAIAGAMTAKWRPDGFLYYALCLWNDNMPIEGGPFTNWNPLSWEDYEGDGSWAYCGPGGKPLASVRLENYRDGVEDYAYACLLESLGGKAVVPPSLVATPKDYSLNPADYYRWRESMADEIERRLAAQDGGAR